MSVEIWLKYSSKDKLQIPVVPEELELASPFGVNKIAVAHSGTVTVPGFRELKSIELSSFFPAEYNATYCSYKKIPEPSEAVKKIEKWRTARKPIQLIITELGVNMSVMVEDFPTSIKAGAVGDIYYTLKLTQYVEPKTAKVKKTSTKAKAKSTGKKGARPAKVNTKTASKVTKYSVSANDTLSKIAQKAYGDASQWRKIYDANKKVIGANPNIIKSGQKLVIPK